MEQLRSRNALHLQGNPVSGFKGQISEISVGRVETHRNGWTTLRILDDFETDQKNHGSIDPHLISPKIASQILVQNLQYIQQNLQNKIAMTAMTDDPAYPARRWKKENLGVFFPES